MHIFRWLLTHPIITAWILAALVILLNLNMGSEGTQDDEGHANAEISHEASKDVSHQEPSAQAEPAAQATEPAAQATEPAAQATEPAEPAAATEPAAQATEPAAQATEPSAQATEPSAQATEPSAQATEPAAQATEPSAQATEPAAQATEPSAQATEPSAQATEPAAQATPASDETKSGVSAGKVAAGVATAAIATAAIQNNNENKASPAVAKENDSASADTENLSTMSPEDLLKLAREAFWQNEKDKAIDIYKVLTEKEPSSLSYKGELANVLWHQNKHEESAALYAEIAMPMLKEGKAKEVASMLGFIGVFFPEKAREIHRSMTQLK